MFGALASKSPETPYHIEKDTSTVSRPEQLNVYFSVEKHPITLQEADMTLQMPDPLLEVIVSDLAATPSLTGICAGYERDMWRASQLADHVMNWLPEFALTYLEYEAIRHFNASKYMRDAARRVYESDKYRNRGEFGELFLHIAIRQIFNSIPAVSKIFFKSATNDTVKGFDAIHVVGPPEELELWLGEAKFYENITDAIRDVINELKIHLTSEYLRREFTLIINKIDCSPSHAEVLKRLLKPETSLDQVFRRMCIPVLLTYDSPCVAGHTETTEEYRVAFENEVKKHHESFSGKLDSNAVRIHLILFPLYQKEILVKRLDEKLKTWQQI